MTDPPDPPEALARALDALGPSPAMPPALAARLVAAAQREDDRLTRTDRRRRAMRRMSLVAATVFACGAAALLWPGDSAARQAVAKAAQKLREAKGVKVVERTTTHGQPERDEPVATQYQAGPRRREERGHTVTISDGVAGVKLTLDADAKSASRSLLSADDLKHLAPARVEDELTSLVREVKSSKHGGDSTSRADELIDRRKMRVYSMGGPVPMKLFIDTETDIPRRIIQTHDDCVKQFDIALLDADPDPKLFDLAVPPGYTLLDPAAKPKPAPDDHWAESMRRLARMQSLRLTATWDDNRGPDSRTAPRTYRQTVTMCGAVTRLDAISLPGMPGLKLAGETVEQTYLSDSSTKPGRLLYVNHSSRRAWEKATLELPYVDLRKYLGTLANALGQPVGADRVGGAACDVYKLPDTDTLVWVSRETLLPARISIAEKTRLVAVLERFDYDPAIDPALFDFAPPAGYEVLNR